MNETIYRVQIALYCHSDTAMAGRGCSEGGAWQKQGFLSPLSMMVALCMPLAGAGDMHIGQRYIHGRCI